MTNVKPDIACLACQSSKTELTPYIDKPFYGDDIIDFSKMQICFCWDCGLGCSIPEVEGNLLDKFYSIQYRAKSSIHFIDFPRLTKPKISQCKNGIEHLLLARHFTKVESGDNFLDIGPGPGWHFPAALSLLENPNLFAIEYNQMAAVSYSRLYGAKTFSGFEFSWQDGDWTDNTPEERLEVLERIYENGSLELWLSSFKEIFFDNEKNA